MKPMILICHGAGKEGVYSIPHVKTITPAGKVLDMGVAKQYIHDSAAKPEYASTSFDNFSPLSLADISYLFDGKVHPGNHVGIYDTRHFKGTSPVPTEVYVLVGEKLTHTQLTYFINTNHFTSCILLACRNRAEEM